MNGADELFAETSVPDSTADCAVASSSAVSPVTAERDALVVEALALSEVDAVVTPLAAVT